MEDAWVTQKGMVILMTCIECKEDYPQWSILSSMTCPNCKVTRERKRCAEIAEELAVHHDFFDGGYEVGKKIAKKILDPLA